jgi:hypothetical protein
MPDIKFSQLNQLDVAVAEDYIPIVDASDSAMGVNGTNKIITVTNLKNSLLDLDIGSLSDPIFQRSGETNILAIGSGTITPDSPSSRNIIASGSVNAITNGNHNIIGSGSSNNITDGTFGFIGAGFNNIITSTTSSIVGGISNTASGGFVFIGGGSSNVASGTNSSVTGGSDAFASLYGEDARASGKFNVAGDAQVRRLVMRGQTNNSSLVNLTLDGISQRLLIEPNTTWAYTIMVVARNVNTIDSAAYKFEGLLERSPLTTTKLGEVKTVLFEDSTPWDINTAVSSNELQLRATQSTFTGQVYWVANIEIVQVRVPSPSPSY